MEHSHTPPIPLQREIQHIHRSSKLETNGQRWRAFYPLVQRWLDFLSAYTYTLEDHEGSAIANADFLSRLSLTATERDRTGTSRLAHPDGVAVYLVRSCAPTAAYVLECHPDGPTGANDVLRAPGGMDSVFELRDGGTQAGTKWARACLLYISLTLILEEECRPRAWLAQNKKSKGTLQQQRRARATPRCDRSKAPQST